MLACDAPETPDWRRQALFLDFDGTLAPLRPRPDEVRLPDRERRLVERLIGLCDGAVAILTGRDLSDIAGLLDGLPVAISGSHGAEIQLPGQAPARPASADALHAPFATLSRFARDNDLLLERKTAALALHYRDRPEMQDKVQDCVARLAQAAPDRLKFIHGNMVSEITTKGHDKGTALTFLMQTPAFRHRKPMAIGDDTTDEDAIRAARALGGIGLRIGTGPTGADHAFADRQAFVDWLETVAMEY